MAINNYVLLAYGVFLLILLIINLLYFLQVFKYRLPGDAAMTVLIIHLLLMLLILGASTALIV